MNKEEREKMLADVLSRKRSSSEDISVNLDLIEKSGDEINKLLQKNEEELEKLTKSFNSDETSFAKLKEEVERDFGIKSEVADKVILGKEEKEIFERIEKQLKENIVGQDETIEQLTIALRRPYVVGSDLKKIRNSIILYGSNGTGRHLIIEEASKCLKQEGLTSDDGYSLLDMSRYNSSSQEILFLQDLYVALTSSAPFIVVENYKEASPIFNRMLTGLVTEGKCLLNKRYVYVGGQLQEATSKLTTDIIDCLDGNDKILVFISEDKPSKMLDDFGTSFLEKIVDKIGTKNYDDESLKTIIKQLLEGLIKKCHNQLEIEVKIDEKVHEYLMSLHEPSEGVDSITPIIDKIFSSLVDIALKEDIKECEIDYIDKLSVKYNGQEKLLEVIEDDSNERQEIQAELDEIVGLDTVKEYLLSLENHLKVNQLRKQKGLKTAELSKHMVFTGNPGTGKTTIARLVSRMMKACGILKQGQLVEVTRADLVGKYVGHTAPLTMSVIQSALGGVLFIDEAYSLYRGKDDSFGLEAIDTLVKAMEDHRDDLIVILAGYSKEMEEFLMANSGLKSRFANIIDFPDYTGEELSKIAISIAKGKDYRIEEKAIEPLKEYFTLVQAKGDYTSGNGRLARNIVEDAILKQSKRILDKADEEFDLLKLEDFDINLG